jgi:hypothetical protein
MFFGLLHAERTFAVSVIQIAAAAINVALSALLVATAGMMGAVVATFVATIVQCVMAYYMARPYFVIPFEWGRVSRMVALMFGLFWIAKDFHIGKTGMSTWVTEQFIPFVEQMGHTLAFDRLWNGKLMLMLIDRAPFVIDGVLLFFYSGLFVAGLLLLKIIPSDVVWNLLRLRRLLGQSA